MILTGSSAIKNAFSDFKRSPKDLDFLVEEFTVTKKETSIDGKRCEYLRLPVLDKFVDYSDQYLDINILYTIKASHIFWDIKWNKHIYDIQFLNDKGCQLNDKLFYELYDYWCSYHGNHTQIDFNKSNLEFFDDKVKRKVNHDDLHELIKVYNKPMFNFIKEDVNRAEVSEMLFNQLSDIDKALVVEEETCVLAYERYIMTNYTTNSRIAYSKALKDLLMRLSPVWLGKYIIKNYTKLNKPNIQYIKLINEKINI